ncbi:MAG: YifB family Mg chelatase-like AAA ATPase, partial [Oligoflexia bacterium]|nr:YifB family Mg chelatase-like AAA ATPase [Oligoflexia bacterium]
DDTVFFGELSLDGQLRRGRGALSLALMARDIGAKRMVLPLENAPEAAVVEGLDVLGVRDLEQVVAWMSGEQSISPAVAGLPASQVDDMPDLCEVRGQQRARRALEIAAAGGHNLLLVGAPGCGKTMLAARVPGILPRLTFHEAIDVTRVWSVAGLLREDQGLLTERPFRAPHHSISAAGMVGSASLRPGELSLAHNGVLFLDEVPEFSRHVLELIRGPLEDRQITLTRAAGTVRLPASVTLVAAANPCPCGYLGHPTRPCTCPPASIERYRARLSGPLLDRIDLQVWVQPVEPEALSRGQPGEASAPVRARVEAARGRQRARFKSLGLAIASNAELDGDAIRTNAQPTQRALAVLEDKMERLGMPARAWFRTLKVARTIADIDGAGPVDVEHVLEACSYRLPDGEAVT